MLALRGTRTALQMSDLASGVLVLLPVLAAIVAGSPPRPVAAQPAPSPPVLQVSCQPTPLWVVNFEPMPERSAPDDDSDPDRDAAPVHLPGRARLLTANGPRCSIRAPGTVGFVPSDAIGPTDPPPAYVTADPPPAVDEINDDGRAHARRARCRSIPRPIPTRRPRPLAHNTPVSDRRQRRRRRRRNLVPHRRRRLSARDRRCACRGRRRGRSPAAGSTSTCASRRCWSPTTATTPVLTTLTIHGAGPRPTPIGVFTDSAAASPTRR